ncbi:helix-turn-helix domain-containing protein [Saccharopolyspora shandongensis]|uniref:helix-turn-helix domain-containing protein n=1 Tax=Saccharopolyspora shandongensis TaxID=418495 RepID=UPI003419F900
MTADRRSDLTALLRVVSEAIASIEESQRSQPHQVQPREVDAGGPVLISVPEAAKILGLTRATAYRYADADLLPVKRFGRRVYVIRARLDELTIPDTKNSTEADAA